MGLLHRKSKGADWSKYLEEPTPQTRKKNLIVECKRRDVSIYSEDAAEGSSTVYNELRGVASEAELERRLLAKIVVEQSSRANWIAGFALFVSLISLAISLILVF